MVEQCHFSMQTHVMQRWGGRTAGGGSVDGDLVFESAITAALSD